MKSLFKLHSLDSVCLNKRLNESDYRIYLLELSHSGADKHITGKTDIHSQVIDQVSQRINSIEFIPNSTYSLTINIEIK